MFFFLYILEICIFKVWNYFFLLQIRIVVLRTKPGDGYIAFDDYSIKTDVSRESCQILPSGIYKS